MRDTFLPYCRPDVGMRELTAVAESISNGWLTTGPQTAAFEAAFAKASGAQHVVALNSCTAGLHLCLLALGVGAGDEVIMPSLTFVAGAQCALELGARPVFCEVEADTFTASISTIAACVTPRTKAIIAMPYGGRPMGIADLCEFARTRGIAVIEDAAHGAGMLDRGEWPGKHSSAAVYSFYATKNLTTGEGGMVTTSDPELADRVRRLSLHGMSRDAWQRYAAKGSWRYDVLEPGYKYNIADVASSIGIIQLERLDEMQARRDRIARLYRERLADVPGLAFQREPDHPNDRHSWCMFAMTVDEREAGIDRDEFVERLKAENIGTSVHYIPSHLFTAYKKLPTAPLPVTEAIGASIVSLPLYPTMSDADVEDTIDAVTRVIKKARTAESRGALAP